ncbi:MAG: T9SS type A sorting domain-containing protein [Flavobacteriaceae bacterium]
MKHFYLLICLLFLTINYAQQPAANGDIPGFLLYPNPVTQGKVYITSTANAPKKILIFDVLGTQVLQTTILGSELNLTSLDAGVYVLRVIEKDKVATRKLIVK